MYEVLRGKNVFLSGATGGIGSKLAFELAKTKCNLFLTGQNKEKLNQLESEFSQFNEIKVHCRAANLEKQTDVSFLIDEAKRTLGSVDILINCAGIFIVKPLIETTFEEYERCLNVNLRAPFLFTKEFSKEMIENKWGRVINIGSSSSYSGFKNTSLYCASKHALLGLSRSLHNELKESNIRTYCFSPGSVKTEMGKKVKNQNFDTFIDPEELAKYVVYTIGYDSNMISEEIRLNRINIK